MPDIFGRKYEGADSLKGNTASSNYDNSTKQRMSNDAQALRETPSQNPRLDDPLFLWPSFMKFLN